MPKSTEARLKKLIDKEFYPGLSQKEVKEANRLQAKLNRERRYK